MHRYDIDENCPAADELEARSRTGRRCLAILGVMIVVMLLSAWLGIAQAQTVPGAITLRWTLPTTGCIVGASPAVCGQPLTGANAIAGVSVWISTSPIPDDVAQAPTLTLSASSTTTNHTMQVANGATLYARVAARTGTSIGVMSNQITKVVVADVKPGAPTNVTIELVIGAP